MARFTGSAVAGGLSGLANAFHVVKGGGNVTEANSRRKASLRSKALRAKAEAKRKAERERQRFNRANRASKARSAVEACPVCLRRVEGRTAASILYKLLNGAVLTVSGYACDSHGEGDAFGDVGTVQGINRNVSLTLEPEGRFYMASPKAEVVKVPTVGNGCPLNVPLLLTAARMILAPKGEVIPTVDNREYSMFQLTLLADLRKAGPLSPGTLATMSGFDVKAVRRQLRNLATFGKVAKGERSGRSFLWAVLPV